MNLKVRKVIGSGSWWVDWLRCNTEFEEREVENLGTLLRKIQPEMRWFATMDDLKDCGIESYGDRQMIYFALLKEKAPPTSYINQETFLQMISPLHDTPTKPSLHPSQFLSTIQGTSQLFCPTESNITQPNVPTGPVKRVSQCTGKRRRSGSLIKRKGKRWHNKTPIIDIINDTFTQDSKNTGILWIVKRIDNNFDVKFISVTWKIFYDYYRQSQNQPYLLNATIREKFQPGKCKKEKNIPVWQEYDYTVLDDYDMSPPDPSILRKSRIYTYLLWWTDFNRSIPKPKNINDPKRRKISTVNPSPPPKPIEKIPEFVFETFNVPDVHGESSTPQPIAIEKKNDTNV